VRTNSLGARAWRRGYSAAGASMGLKAGRPVGLRRRLAG